MVLDVRKRQKGMLIADVGDHIVVPSAMMVDV